MSKDKITVKMVEQKYRAGIQAFARTLGDPTLRLNFMQEADPFFRRCALAVWKHGSPVTEKYVDTYNAICSGENAAPSILFFELCAAVEGAPEFAPPPFFADLLRADQTSRRNSAKKSGGSMSTRTKVFPYRRDTSIISAAGISGTPASMDGWLR